jgi:hypothetical protein
MSIASPEVDVRQTTIESIDTESLAKTDNTDGTKDDNLRHIVRPADNPHLLKHSMTGNPTGAEIVEMAMIRKIEITALCGKTWVPKLNNPAGRDTCDTCVGMAGLIKSQG